MLSMKGIVLVRAAELLRVEPVEKVEVKNLQEKRSPYLAFKRRLGSGDHLSIPSLDTLLLGTFSTASWGERLH